MDKEKKKILRLIKKYEGKICSSKKQRKANNKKLRKMMNALFSLYNHESSSATINEESKKCLTELELNILKQSLNKSREALQKTKHEIQKC